MKFLDLFAGIGGFRLGLEQAGHECVGWVEWDKFARKSYQAIHDTEGEYEGHDIKSITGSELPAADIWAFGSPCTNISIAGNGAGLSGEQSSMFFEVMRLLREIDEKEKPKYLFMENVKNLLSSNRGWDFARVIFEMDEVGYDVEWDVLDSAEVVPQHRERIFIIGHLRTARTRKVFPIIRQNGEANNTVKQVGNLTPDGSFGGNPQVGRVYGTDGISPTLSTIQGGGQEPKVAVREATKIGYDVAQLGDSINFAQPNSKTRRGRVGHGVANTLTTGIEQATLIQVASSVKKYANAVRPNAKPIVRITSKKNIRGSRQDSKKSGLSELQFTNPSNKSNTVTASHAPKTWDKELRIRKLTPRECWRLQGFPDWAFDKAKEAGLSNSQLYKQAGNSVTVPVIYEIAKRMNWEED